MSDWKLTFEERLEKNKERVRNARTVKLERFYIKCDDVLNEMNKCLNLEVQQFSFDVNITELTQEERDALFKRVRDNIPENMHKYVTSETTPITTWNFQDNIYITTGVNYFIRFQYS